ncbi:hypothetical protein BDP27DRAFT_1319723 [Rhodocollybia butyracea]|uniref:Nucleoporin Nup159/Nup146 N-terminal domain-containing protein n=1 Tax=Rhodocollybia butyracea TaxID=206335 RepID=A0A9P5PV22_9AGAR|nr:hypothetical protein BDP27DRAFT_1319723 [Rhodocollybia butyracea]
MAELTRLVRPAPQVSVSTSSKECHSEGIKYPNFRLLNKKSRVSLSPQYLSTDQNYAYRTMVVSNKNGWFAAVHNNAGIFAAVLSPLSELRRSMKDISPFVAQRTLSFSTSEPNLLALANNDSRLVVGFKSGQIIVYDTSAVFTPGSNEIQPIGILQTSQQPIIDIASNPNTEDPTLSALLAVVRVDGSVHVFNTNLEPQGGWIAGDADSAPVTVAWSPKGKQLAIGLRLGDILTFTLDNKSTPQRHIPPTSQGTLVSLSWLAPGHTFRTTYAASEPVHHIVHSDKRMSPIVWTRLEHSFQVPDRRRQNSYSVVLPKWDNEADDRFLVVVGDASCTDLEIIANVGMEWFQQSQENPLSIPLDKDSEDTVLLSLQLDLTDLESAEGGFPILYAYLNDGTVQGWYVDHPERKQYAGMAGMATNMMSSTSQSQQTSAFGQPTSSPSFGQPSGFGSSTKNLASFGAASGTTTSAFGQPSFGQSAFSQVVQTPPFGSSNSSGPFSSFASDSTSPFGAGFGSQAPATSSFGTSSVEAAPQITRDDSMSDSTPAFGGLSLGESSDEATRTKSTFGGGGGMFGTPTPLPLPPNHPSNQLTQPSTSAFGSGSGSFIKPASGFGAFGGTSTGNFGAFGNASNSTSTSTSTNAFSAGAFSANPNQTSAFAASNEQPKSSSGFGQSGFGQPAFGQSSFGKPSFGQTSFGQSSFVKPAVSNPSAGGFGAFAQTGPVSLASAASVPSKSDGGGGGFASFSNAPSTFGSANSGGAKDGDGGFSAFASKSPSPFGQSSTENKAASPFGSQLSGTSGGAFSNFASSGPSVFGQPAAASVGGAFGGLKSESPSVFGQPAPLSSVSTFGQPSGDALGTPSTSVFGQPVPSGSGGAFGGLRSDSPSIFGSPAPTSSTPFGVSQLAQSSASGIGSMKAQQITPPVKSEPGSPTLPSSPASASPSPSPTPQPSSPVKAASGGAFGDPQSVSSSAFKPATGFGAFSNTLSSSSPFLNPDKPVVSAFGTPSSGALGSATKYSATGPTFGSTSKLGFGFGIKKPESVSPPASSQASASTAFDAFSGTNLSFTEAAGPTQAFSNKLSETGEPAIKPSSPMTTSSPVRDLLGADVKTEDDDAQAALTDKDKGNTQKQDEDQPASTPQARLDKGKGKAQKENGDDQPARTMTIQSGDGRGKVIEEPSKDTFHESISSASSSFVEVNGSDDNAEGKDEVPESDRESEEQHGDDDDGDFLSESYGSQSGEDEEELEEGESEGVDENFEEPSPLSSPEPTEIPLPRSRSNTPQAEAPKVDPASPLSSDDSDSSRLSTIREESTTPPGSPPRTQTVGVPAIVAPTPINSPTPTTSLGIGRPSTRPTRSSPLANKPLTTGDATNEEEEEIGVRPTIIMKPRPASPRTPFGVLPKSRSTSPEEAKDGKRPKTPPLLSSFFGSTPTPSTPKPAPATLPSSATPSKAPVGQITPLLNTPMSGFSSSSSSSSLFGKPFSLQPPAIGAEAAPSTLGIFSPPVNPEVRSSPQRLPTPLVGSQRGPFSPPVESNTAGFPASGALTGQMVPPASMPVPQENGMQKECHIVVDAMEKDLERLRVMAQSVAKKRENLSRSAGGSRRQQDLGHPEKWAMSDSTQFGVLLRQYEHDISELKSSAEKQKEELRELGKSIIKAGTRREEIARFNKAKSDNEFSKMLRSRTLGPEHLENQTQLRRNIRALRNKVDQLEDQLRAHKKRLSEVNSGRPTLKPPSLDTIHRTYRNIDLALQQQSDDLAQLTARFLKLDLNASFYSSHNVKDPRLPQFPPRSRPSIITQDVAVTTAAALNAERSAHNLKTMLLKARKDPLLNVKAKELVEGGTKVPTSYNTPKAASSFSVGSGLQFSTPIIQRPLFGTSPSNPEVGHWDTLSFPEDNFQPSSIPLSSGGRRGVTPQRKHEPAPPVRKSPAPEPSGGPKATATSPAGFDWGNLPTFNKPSPVLPGFDMVMSNPPSTPPVGFGPRP